MNKILDPAHIKMRERAFSGFSIEGLTGVEIGPLSRPLVDKEQSTVYYVDHCPTEELKAKYKGHQYIPQEDIVDVDFVWRDNPLAESLGNVAPVDYVVASHVIEHVPDLVGWLKEMHDALREGGTLVLIVPDKRFTFDVCRRTSSFEEVKTAYKEKRRQPGLRCVMDHFANVVQADCYGLWADYRGIDTLPFAHDPSFLTLAAKHYEEGRYIDVHCWVFTPWSFLALIGQIADNVGLAFDLAYFDTTHENDLEFYVRLVRTSQPATDWKNEAVKAEATALWPANRNA